jgi:hypothetical protein
MATSLHYLAPPTGRQTGANDVRIAMTRWLTPGAASIGLSVGRASDRDETALTVQVSSADHDQAERLLLARGQRTGDGEAGNRLTFSSVSAESLQLSNDLADDVVRRRRARGQANHDRSA